MLGIYYWIVDEVLLQAKKGGNESWILLAMATGCRRDLSRGITKVVPHEVSDQRPDSFPLKVMFSLAFHLGVWLSSSLCACMDELQSDEEKIILMSFNQNRLEELLCFCICNLLLLLKSLLSFSNACSTG